MSTNNYYVLWAREQCKLVFCLFDDKATFWKQKRNNNILVNEKVFDKWCIRITQGIKAFEKGQFGFARISNI